MEKETKQLKLNFDQLRASMAAVQAQQQTIGGKVSTYEKQLGQLAQIRNTLQQVARAQGAWSTESFRTVSASQKLTQSLVDQKLGAREAFRAWKNGYFKQMINEQHSLRNSFATQMTGSGFGKSTVDLYAPKGVAKEIRSWTTEMGVYSHALKSVSQQTINWGKNTQWAGRQMMVGLTVPLGIAAVGMAKQAYEIDKQLTRIAKVYDTQSTAGLEGAEKTAAAERELAQLRTDSLDMATRAANEYGAAVKDTLEVESQLAATGLHGGDLTRATTEVVRIATLGELDYQDAINTTISLQTAFKLNNDELTKSFNMMNAVENATSLTIQDIAEAVPRAASAMSALGGTVEDMTVMLVAMRESGVDPAIAANAIKSATSALLDPTKEAIEYWKKTFDVDLPAIVERAGGNVYKIIQEMAKATKGFDPLAIQKGINNTFGRYQFDRISGLFTNIGDAMNGFENQTLKAMETVGMSTTDLADIADTEMQRFQQSISGKFKRAVESMKAELVPLGMSIMEFVTPLVDGLKGVVAWFNDLSDTKKKIILWGLGLMAVAGPLVMITGILGNLLGHGLKIPAMLGGMVARFRPMTAEMTANSLVAKRAAMTWDTQTSSAAMLTQSIAALTAAMEANAIAQGHMLSGSGTLNLGGAGSGVTMYRSESGQLRKRTVDPQTFKAREVRSSENSPEGRLFVAAELAAAEKASASIAQHSERTKMSWGQIAGAMGGVAMAAGAFMTMDLSSASIGQNLMTAAMFASSAAMILPSMKGASGFATRIANSLGGNKFAAMGRHMGEIVTYAGIAAGAKGFGGVGGAITKVGAGLYKVLPLALRFFGPIGLIAGGITLLVTAVNKMHELEDAQKAINKSAENWADILGFVHEPGSFNGETAESGSMASRVDDVKALREANEELAKSLEEAAKQGGDFAKVYELSMQEALKVITSGGTAEQAKHAFQISLQTSGIDKQTMERLTLKFDRVDLANPQEVTDQIAEQIRLAISDLPANLRPDGSVLGIGIGGWFSEQLGGDLSDEARAAGTRVGELFAQGIMSNEDNELAQGGLFKGLIENMDNQFLSEFNSLNNGKTKEVFRKLGIESADEMMTAVADAMADKDAGRKLSEAQSDLLEGVMGGGAGNLHNIKEFAESYREAIDVLIAAMGDQMGWGPEKIEAMQKAWLSLAGVANDQNIVPKPQEILSAAKAWDEYNNYMARAGMAGHRFSKEQQLVILNTYRQRAGLDKATDVTQGFGDAAGDAASAAEDLANGMDDSAAAASSYTSAFRGAMSGALSGAFKEADRLLEDANQAEIDGIQASGDRTQKGLDRRGDMQEKAYDREEKSLESSWDNREKAEKAYWDGREKAIDDQIKAVENEADARIESINAIMEKEDEAENQREKIFEAERRRIQRLSEVANRNIDFNAALNSGNLDEAAKIYNTGAATTAQWALDDAQMNESDIRERRKADFEDQIKLIESERDARTDALERAQEQIKTDREASLEATKAKRDAEMEAFQERRKISQESVRQAQEEARLRTQAAVDSAKKKQEADRRALEMELAALREYVPQNEADLRAHIGKVQTAYDKYGHGLQVSGDEWSTIIGNELSTNIAKAAQGLQNDINWQQIGTYISDNIGKGTGMTAAQITEFLRTGKFPEGPQSTATPWAPTGQKAKLAGGGGRQGQFAHSGGQIGWSSKDRTGVPRSASLYPSEVPTVLKKGEFVIDSQGYKHNKGLAEQINGSSKSVLANPMQYEGVKHTGGLIDSAGAMVGLYGAALAKIHEIVGMKKVKDEQARRAAASRAVEMAGGSFAQGSGKYPARQYMKESPNTTAAKKFVQQRWGSRINGVGTVGARSITSDHPWGKAMDVMITKPGPDHYKQPGGIALGTEIANHFVNNPNQFGTKYVIWRDRITEGRGWKPYGHPSGGGGDTLQHRDHPHVSLLHKGGLAGKNGFSAPQLDVGGEVLYDNTLANLHKGEKMLTAPLSRDLESGIRNLDLNRANEYTIEVNFNGPVSSDVDIKKALWAAIDERESRNGKARKVTLT